MVRGASYSELEMATLVQLVGAIKPNGGQRWDRVASEYAAIGYKNNWPRRTAQSLKTKFNELKNTKKPTGDPNCPKYFADAKRVYQEIQAASDVVIFGNEDDALEDEGQENEDPYEENEEEEYEEVGDEEDAEENGDDEDEELEEGELEELIAPGSASSSARAPFSALDNLALASSSVSKGQSSSSADRRRAPVSSLFAPRLATKKAAAPQGKAKKSAATISSPVLIANPTKRSGLSPEQLQEIGANAKRALPLGDGIAHYKQPMPQLRRGPFQLSVL